MKKNVIDRIVKIAVEGNTTVLLYPNGDLRRKVYDEDGRGAGSMRLGPLSKFLYRKEIRQAIADVPAHAARHVPTP